MSFYEIMTLIAVLAFVILVVFAVRALMQIKKTAEAAEYLVLTTAEKVEKTNSTFELLDNVSSLLDSTFFRAVKLGMSLVDKYKHKKED